MEKMKQATMLYKSPGKHFMRGHGGSFDYIVVDKCDEKAYDDALAGGWHESTTEALKHTKIPGEHSDKTAFDFKQKTEAEEKAKADAKAKKEIEAADVKIKKRGRGES